jgi:tRNA U34 2-thiouridine synthase MnmA/TrmU
VLEQPSYGVAPGQLAVLYDEDGTVVGSGLVLSAARN